MSTRPLTQAEVDERMVALLRRMVDGWSPSPACDCEFCVTAAEAAALLPDLADRVFAAQDEAAKATNRPLAEYCENGFHNYGPAGVCRDCGWAR